MYSPRSSINTLMPRRNRQYFADDVLKRIFFNDKVWFSITISLKFVAKGRINNVPTSVRIMAWWRQGDKPLSGPMMASFLTHICVMRPQWVNFQSEWNGCTYWQLYIGWKLTERAYTSDFTTIIAVLNAICNESWVLLILSRWLLKRTPWWLRIKGFLYL